MAHNDDAVVAARRARAGLTQDARLTALNAAADAAAKRAAAANFPSDAVIGQFTEALAEAKAFAKGAARILAMWPSSAELYGRLPKVPTPPSLWGSPTRLIPGSLCAIKSGSARPASAPRAGPSAIPMDAAQRPSNSLMP